MAADTATQPVPFGPRRVLVTGSAGFIGSTYVRQLLADPAVEQVVSLDLLTYAGRPENLADLATEPRHRLVHGDIADGDLVACLLQEHAIDAIVHFAAESHVDRSIVGPAAFIRTNVVGTFTLLEAARRRWLEAERRTAGTCRFLHVSTDEVYGQLGPDEPAFTERTPYAPNSPYAASKASSDLLARAYHHTYGLPVVTTNCSNNYGPRQHAEKFLPTVIRACLTRTPIPIYGRGLNVRDWIFVEDHCRAVDLVLRGGRSGETYLIGAEAERRNIDMVHAVCAAMAELTGEPLEHFTELISYVTDRPGHDWRYAINPTKIRAELGWHPQYSLSDGLRRTVAWYRDAYANDPHWSVPEGRT